MVNRGGSSRPMSPSEPELAIACVGLRAGWLTPATFFEAFASATVYCQRPGQPGVMVGSVTGQGDWVPVFSSLERLGRFAGECDWQSTTGADLQSLLPAGVGMVLDVQDPHVVAVPASPDDD